jgi:hypothetical protein
VICHPRGQAAPLSNRAGFPYHPAASIVIGPISLRSHFRDLPDTVGTYPCLRLGSGTEVMRVHRIWRSHRVGRGWTDSPQGQHHHEPSIGLLDKVAHDGTCPRIMKAQPKDSPTYQPHHAEWRFPPVPCYESYQPLNGRGARSLACKPDAQISAKVFTRSAPQKSIALLLPVLDAIGRILAHFAFKPPAQ